MSEKGRERERERERKRERKRETDGVSTDIIVIRPQMGCS